MVKPYLPFIVLSVATVDGCGGPKDASALLAPERAKPGFVRLFNLSSDQVAMSDHGRLLNTPLTTNEASPFTTFPCGPRLIRIKGQSVDFETKMDLKSGASTTIVLGIHGKSLSRIADRRTSEDGRNVRLIYLNREGREQVDGPAIAIEDSQTRLMLSAKARAITVPEGKWICKGKDLDDAEPLVVLPDCLYDLMLIKDQHGQYHKVILSHKIREKAYIAATKGMR